MAVRLKYAGIPVEKVTIDDNITPAIKNTLSGGAGAAYLFSSYTALWTVQKAIKSITVEGGAAR